MSSTRDTGPTLIRPLGIGLIFLALASCTAPGPTIQEGFAKYEARQPEDSEAIADKFIAANPNSAQLDEAYYLRGLSRMLRGNRPAAASDLHEALKRTNRTDLKGKANWALGDIAYDLGQWEDAQKEYEQALSSGAVAVASIPTLTFRIGAALQAQGKWPAAQPWFGRVATHPAATPELKERALGRMYATSYALQYGAFHEGPRARDLANQLQSAGIPPAIKSEMREGQLLYLVQSGSYPTMAAATAAREKIQPRYPLVTIVP